jgi:hypothetical protein
VGPAESHADYAPAVVPGSEKAGPPPPPLTPEEVESQIAAARGELSELEKLGVDTVRTVKMLALAESFQADGNIEMASQYAKKTAKLARDQKARRESEVDEDTARRFINETQMMLDASNASGQNVRQAKKLMGLSISFMADGNYVTGMQYSKKVRKMIDELRDREERPPLTVDSVNREMDAAEARLAELRRAGETPSQAETELDTARMFLDEGDLPPAMVHAARARTMARDMKETERPLSPQQWRDRMAILRERVERQKADGLRTAEPLKMLKFSESFALQGNLEVATQYVRKAEKLMDDIATRAKVDASKPGPDKGQMICPGCGEDIEADWVVCAYCNNILKPGAEWRPGAGTGIAGTGEPDRAAGQESRATGAAGETAPKDAGPPERGIPPPAKEVRVAKPVDDGEAAAGKPAKVATPVDGQDAENPAPGRCPNCGLRVQPGWAICPVCETPLNG